VNTEFSVHRADWSNFTSLTDDFSQTPAYQGGAVSDATWPTVYGDDAHFVVYFRGTPVSEFVTASTPDPIGGSEPSCLASSVASVTSGLAPSFVLSALPAAELAASQVTSRSPMALKVVAQGTIARLASTTRTLVPGGGDLEVVSDTPFPMGDAMAVLHAGDVEVLLSRFPDPNDVHRLTFTFSADQFASLSGGETLSVRYGRGPGGPQWDLGQLDKTQLAK